MHTHAHTYTFIYTRIHAHTHIYIHVRTDTHTLIHTHTHLLAFELGALLRLDAHGSIVLVCFTKQLLLEVQSLQIIVCVPS